jgi:hypothetical protein
LACRGQKLEQKSQGQARLYASDSLVGKCQAAVRHKPVRVVSKRPGASKLL